MFQFRFFVPGTWFHIAATNPLLAPFTETSLFTCPRKDICIQSTLTFQSNRRDFFLTTQASTPGNHNILCHYNGDCSPLFFIKTVGFSIHISKPVTFSSKSEFETPHLILPSENDSDFSGITIIEIVIATGSVINGKYEWILVSDGRIGNNIGADTGLDFANNVYLLSTIPRLPKNYQEISQTISNTSGNRLNLIPLVGYNNDSSSGMCSCNYHFNFNDNLHNYNSNSSCNSNQSKFQQPRKEKKREFHTMHTHTHENNNSSCSIVRIILFIFLLFFLSRIIKPNGMKDSNIIVVAV